VIFSKEFSMRIFLLLTSALFGALTTFAQDATTQSSTPATAADVAALRQEVQSLVGTVKTLQQQVKDQQAIIEKANLAGGPVEKQETETATASASPAPNINTPPFPTEDSSVVASSTAPSAGGVNANGTATSGAFPTMDESVVTSTSDTSIVSGGSSLTAPITIGGGRIT
jgi:hypothetical protein